jgi:FAD/FMN-containing dehydrogenase
MSGAYRSFGIRGSRQRRAMPAEDAILLLEKAGSRPGGLLAFGNGRSYGDSCLNDEGVLIDCRTMNRVLAFDPQDGVIEAEAGILLGEILAHVGPYGFFPPVLPGTQFVTLGGAIANDVHGKNHHRQGSFGCHVEWITLLRSDGRRLRLSARENAELFSATIGGMGLTGLILSARLRLMRVPTTDIEETVMSFSSLEDYFERSGSADTINEYAVAWVDQLAGNRGLMITGNHPSAGRSSPVGPHRRLSVPFVLPFAAVNRWTLAAFNALYFRDRSRRSGKTRRVGCQGFFFPLDGVGHWNRLYGPRGLLQHQSVIPEPAARRAIPEMLARTRAAGETSFLTVLKRFGGRRSPGLLSFARPGYTLTLDFPHRGASTLALLDMLDRITLEAGGAVNPYKDARMSAETFAASFPDWPRLEALRDRAFMSDFWRRTAMCLERDRGTVLKAAE